jgi:adenine-specific DNA-methyltransferase
MAGDSGVAQQKTEAVKAGPPASPIAMADAARETWAESLTPERRASLGQFFTPANTALRMASMLGTRRRSVRLLDPGAGVGALTAAAVEALASRRQGPVEIHAVLHELDEDLSRDLQSTAEACARFCADRDVTFSYEIRCGDFVEESVDACSGLWAGDDEGFDCAILNPPYRKIHSESRERRLLRSLDIETSNLYTAFLLLVARRLSAGGELVSINPRSCCNGPYFRSFRAQFLSRMSLRWIHVFGSRRDTFKADGVLQENVIFHGRRSGELPGAVCVSSDSEEGTHTRRVDPEQVVQPADPDRVIHLVTDRDGDVVTARMRRLPATLDTLGCEVSTGPVVAFRLRAFLAAEPTDTAVPLLYPGNLRGGEVHWPRPETGKPQWVLDEEATDPWLLPNGWYVLVKRFSAKEEPRRIVAAVLDPARLGSERVGLENHLNFFHKGGSGLPHCLALGLAMYLNSDLVDRYFRQFSGHTQVNAADLRRLRYPGSRQLEELAGTGPAGMAQTKIDEALEPMVREPQGVAHGSDRDGHK